MRYTQETLAPGKSLRQLANDSPLPDANWVLAFGSVKRLQERRLPTTLRRRYPDARIVGCSTSGEISRDGVADDSLHVTAMRWEHTRLEVASQKVSAMEASRKIGAALADQLKGPGLGAVFVLSDGLNVNGSELVDGLRDRLGDIPVLGGLAGDGAQFTRTLLLHDDRVTDHLVVAVGLYGDGVRVASGALGGWRPYGPARTITRSSKNVVYEMDGKPALPLYKMYIGYYAEELPASGLRFPFAILDDNRSVTAVRTLLATDDAADSLIFAGNVPEGASVRFLQANHRRLVDGADAAAHQVLDAAPDLDNPGVAVCVSCVGRKLVLGEQVADEVYAVRRLLGPRTALTGFYSNGEICPGARGGLSLLHNQTMTIAYMAEAG